jgi:nitrous-oxide reductase
MQGYVRVSPKGSNVPIKFWTGKKKQNIPGVASAK